MKRRMQPNWVTIRIVLALAMVLVVYTACAQQQVVEEQNVLTIQTQNNGVIPFHVELATTEPEQEKGLMDRKFMAKDSGMFFVFPFIDKKAFWMHDTLIPLDLLFIDKDGTINHIHHMAKPQDDTKITSDKPVKAVLEINGGLSDIMGIQEGDKIIHPVFRNQLDD